MAGKLGQPQYLIWERPEYRSPSPDHHGCGDVLYPDAPYRSLELPLKSSRLQVHGCFLDGSATCNKKNEQYVPAGRGLGRHSLFPHAVPLLSGNEAAVWSDSAIPPLQLLQFF